MAGVAPAEGRAVSTAEAMEVVAMEVVARVVAVRGAQKLEPRRAPRT